MTGLMLVVAMAGGCASVSQPAAAGSAPGMAPLVGAHPADPWERFNRAVFAFNEAIDDAVLVPLAKAYKAIVPAPLVQAFGNVVANVEDAWSAVNHALQAKPRAALETGMRVSVNSVFGLGGLLDVASEAGLERQSEDFGQTLGRWGFGPGPYLVLPFFGPSSVRDGLALPLDRAVDISTLAADGGNRYALTALELVHKRAGLLGATSLLGQVALDRYSFVRDTYLARRRNAVYDGNPPSEDDEAQEQAGEARLRK